MDSTSTQWLYVAACLVIPALWGVCCAWLFAKFDTKRTSETEEKALRPPVDYSI